MHCRHGRHSLQASNAGMTDRHSRQALRVLQAFITGSNFRHDGQALQAGNLGMTERHCRRLCFHGLQALQGWQAGISGMAGRQALLEGITGMSGRNFKHGRQFW
jgi:hypothetical protein